MGLFQMAPWLLSVLSFLLLALESKAQSCPGDWIMSGDGKSCYSFMDDSANFLSAEYACYSLGGGHLTSIPNGFEDNIITQKATAHWSDNLLGIFYVGGAVSDGQWHWVDGTNFSYTAWTSGEPRPGRDCIGHYVGQRSWISVDCNQRLQYVCQFSFATTTPPTTPVPLTTPNPCSSANYVYSSVTGYCYHLLSNCAIYALAYIECDIEGALLTSIHSAEENQLIAQLFQGQAPSNGSCDPNVFWTGLAYDPDTTLWEWVDETPFDYTNEDPDNPIWGNYTAITPVVYNASSVGPEGPYWYASGEFKSFYGVCKMPAVARLQN